MKYIYLLFTVLFLPIQTIYSQSGIKSLTLAPVVFYENSHHEQISSSVRNLLKNKMNRIITKLGLGSNEFEDSHIMFPDIQVLTKDVVPSAPPKVSLTLDLTLYIGDYDRKVIYSSENFELTGVGRNETKAYFNALRRLNANNKKLIAFVEKGKKEIIDYYRNNCDLILNDALVKSKSNREYEALKLLTRIPYDDTPCYKKVSDAIIDTYIAYENKKCAQDLAKAQSIWSASPDYEGALITQQYFSKILPGMQCYDEAIKVLNDMRNYLKEKDLREWKFKMRMYETKSDMLEDILKMIYELEMTKAKNGSGRYKSWW